MKLLHPGAFSLTLSLMAVVQGQSAPNVVDHSDPPPPAEATVAQTISVDLLRQPLPSKAKQILQKAQHAADAGDHSRSIELLEPALAKYPESAAWTQSMLGVEYLKTKQFEAAVIALEQAVLLLPHDAVDRSNLGFALACTGQYDRAERELRRAVALDAGNFTTRQLLKLVLGAARPGHAEQSPLSIELTASSPR